MSVSIYENWRPEWANEMSMKLQSENLPVLEKWGRGGNEVLKWMLEKWDVTWMHILVKWFKLIDPGFIALYKAGSHDWVFLLSSEGLYILE